MKRDHAWLLVVAGVFVLGWLGGLSEQKRANHTHPNPLKIQKGQRLTIEQPTGEVVTGVNGAHPQPVTRSVQLLVYKIQGEPDYLQGTGPPWRITDSDGRVFVAVPD